MKVRKWLYYLLVLVPTITELLETGRWPSHPRDVITDVFLTVLVGVLAWQIYRWHTHAIYLSETDALTGLYNRRKFQNDVVREVARARRLGSSLMLAVMDLDHFKSINDRHTHNEGDRVLKQVAKIMKSSFRRNVDMCYRVGGDEFAVLLIMKDPAGIEGIAKKLARLREQGCEFLEQYGASLSIGITELTDDDTVETFIKRADRLMYEDKEKGRNQKIPRIAQELCRDSDC